MGTVTTRQAALAVGGSLVAGLASGAQGARAAGAAARAQERQSQANLAFAKESRDLALAAADSPQELAALERSMEAEGRQLERSERLLSSVNPALMEASQQAMRLLRGEEAAAGGALREQRKRSRAALVDQLRQQLGPGAETSTAGIQALTRFDQESSSVFAQTQQASLGQLLGTTQFSAGLGQQGAAGAAAGIGGVGSAFGNIASRRVGAITGAGAQIGQAGAGAARAAGGAFVGQQLQAQGIQQLSGQVLQGALGSIFPSPKTTAPKV